MTPMTVFYLHDPNLVTMLSFQDMEYSLSDAFKAFCREHFTFDKPIDYPPLKLITVTSPLGLDEALFKVANSQHFLSDSARDCCLFLIDDQIDDVPFTALKLDGLNLPDWLLTYFPAIPKVVLTYPDHPKVTIPQRRWTRKKASIFNYPQRLKHLFKSFWMPRFWTALRQYVQTCAGTNWHTPGHNGGYAFERSRFLRGFHDAFDNMIFRSDLSVSVQKLGDLSTPKGHTPLSESQRLTSEIFGSAQSCYVTNGTSTSNKAMLMTLLRPGETVLLDRNCHKSVHHAIVMTGAIPHYLPANYNPTLGVWGPIAYEDIEQAVTKPYTLADRPRILIITTCTYEGILYPVWQISRICEKHGMLFYADEAWAPYLAFHPYYTNLLADNTQVRYNAVNEIAGAHFAVQSTHKALAAFSQASMVHVGARFKALLESESNRSFRWLRKRFALNGHGSYEKFSHDLHEILRYWHSTSPHYPTLATLDFSGVQMRLEGLRIIEERLHWVAAFKERVALICDLTQDDCFLSLETITRNGASYKQHGYMQDPLKMVLSFKSVNDCKTFKDALLQAHIQWEKATPVTILFLVTTGTIEEHFEYLYRVCQKLRHTIGRPATLPLDETITRAIAGQPEVLPRDAALCDGELLPLEETEGRIASQLLVPYPPGIPVFIPGLRITQDMIKLIQDVIIKEGADAVHGLFTRGKTHLVEVLNKDEELRVTMIGH